MITKDYLQILQKEIHSTAFATVDEKGLPQVRVIDIMLADDNSLYFLTARGKEFFRQLETQKFVAITGMTGGNRDSLTQKAISIRGKVRNVGQDLLGKIFEENPYMKEIYPVNARHALEVFQLYEGQGEYFDLSSKPIFRDTFTLGDKKAEEAKYVISGECIGCDSCAKICPQQCVEKGSPYSITQENCLNCGLCLENCPVNAIKYLK
jgi:uncharacterized pyridoxamine 5'-phosphate oxidase family protein/Pyruvate/2-oxoacid:ferredoxin oxidoreductase delta subunit